MHSPAPSPWVGARAIVAASGPSLTPAVAATCRAAQRRGWRILAVNDAYRLLPSANVLYACDGAWWDVHKGAPEFAGARWSSTGPAGSNDHKAHWAQAYGLNLVAASVSDEPSFAPGPGIHYGGTKWMAASNSGFQAVNLALVWGAVQIVLVGFDMRAVAGRKHFFGDHPRPLKQDPPFEAFVRSFKRAKASVPAGVSIINATPGSALTAYPMAPLAEALGFIEVTA